MINYDPDLFTASHIDKTGKEKPAVNDYVIL